MTFATIFLLASVIPAGEADRPNRQPQLASAHGQVALTYGAGSSIYFASSPDEGRTFSPPVKVAEAGALALGRHRGPRVTILPDALVVTAVVAPRVATGAHAHGLPENGNLTVWRSTDRGRVWKETGVVNDVPGAAREGLHAIAALPGGGLFAVWLDQRTTGMKLYGARSRDGGVTWSKNTLVYASPDGAICSCCHPSLAVDGAGRIWVMWRNVLDGSRDLFVARSVDGERFEGARKRGAGTWKLNACPMDGGGLALDRGAVVSAWRRENGIYLTRGEAAEIQLGAGKDVAIAATKTGIAAAWTQDGGIVALAPNASEPRRIAEKGGFVTLVALPGNAVLAAWESDGAVESARIE